MNTMYNIPAAVPKMPSTAPSRAFTIALGYTAFFAAKMPVITAAIEKPVKTTPVNIEKMQSIKCPQIPTSASITGSVPVGPCGRIMGCLANGRYGDAGR